MFIFLQFVQIAAKSLIDFVLFYQIAQTHLELMLFQKIVTNHTSVFVLFCKIAETHLGVAATATAIFSNLINSLN